MVYTQRAAPRPDPTAAPEPRPADDPLPAATGVRVQAVDSRALMHGARELCIRHAGELYRLRVTRQNKLILTK